MEQIIGRIHTRRLELKYSFQDLAVLTGMSKSTLQRYESGGIKNIPLDKLKVLAKALDVTPEWIMGWTDEASSEYSPKKPSSDIFALKVKGHSMEPRIFDGDTVIVKKQNDIKSGEIAVVTINGQATTKKVLKQDNGILLVGLNTSAYTPTFYAPDQIEIVGKVVEVRGNMDGWDK